MGIAKEAMRKIEERVNTLIENGLNDEQIKDTLVGEMTRQYEAGQKNVLIKGGIIIGAAAAATVAYFVIRKVRKDRASKKAAEAEEVTEEKPAEGETKAE